jgi:Right handed beta helix region
MKRVFGVSLLVAALLGATLALAPVASAATIDVHPGESIQAAINNASPGDTIVVHPGVYHQSVVVNKNHLTLHGAGASSTGTVIMPPQSSNRCMHGGSGFCVFGKQTSNGIQYRTGTTVEGFLFKGFPVFGLVGFGTKGSTFSHNFAVNDDEYGIACFTCPGVRYLFNKATGAGEAGFYIGDTFHADARVEGNLAYGNGGQGFFFRDSNVGRADGNKAYGNCIGITLLNTGEPNNVHGWTIVDNDSYQNTRECAGGGDEPSSSGLGIAVAGAHDNLIAHNTIWGNHPSGATDLPPAGISVFSTASFGGSKANGNEIRANVLYRNHPDDIFWDQKGAANTFSKNKCDTSNPDGLCH